MLFRSVNTEVSYYFASERAREVVVNDKTLSCKLSLAIDCLMSKKTSCVKGMLMPNAN